MIDEKEIKNGSETPKQEIGSQTESFEDTVEEISDLVETEARNFEIEINGEVAKKEEEGLQNGVSSEEIVEIKKQLGIFGIIDKIKAKAREAADNFRESIMDQKIRRFLDKNPEGFFHNNWVKEFIRTLTLEQIKRHPEIINRVKKLFIHNFKKMADSHPYMAVINNGYARKDKPELSYYLEEIQKWADVFKDKPQIIEMLVNQGEIYQLQDKIFQRTLTDPHNQKYIILLRDLMFMDRGRAYQLLLDMLSSYPTGDSEELGYGRKIDIAKACIDFNIDRPTKFNLLQKYFKYRTEMTYPWFKKSDLMKTFVLNEKDFNDFIEERRSILIEYLYKASIKLLIETPGVYVIPRFWEHLKEQFQFEMNVEEFKSQPYAQEKIKEVILLKAKRAWDPEYDSLETIKFLQSLSLEPIESILQGVEGQEALYMGATYLMSIGRNVATIQDFLEKYQLDLETFRHKPETISVFCKFAEERAENSNYWPTEIEEFLQIPEEKSMDSKIKAIITLLRRDKPEIFQAMNLIASLKLTPQQENTISKAIFGVENGFSYLLRINNLITDKDIPEFAISVLIKDYDRFIIKTDEQIKNYFNIIKKISESPSQEMMRIKDQLIEQILATDNPQKTYEIISNVFIQNNIPLVGKIQRIFDELFPDNVLSKLLKEQSSPVLVKASARKRKHIILQDLLKVHIESANPSLKVFLKLFQQTEFLIAKLEKQEKLSDDEQKKLVYFFKKLKTVIDISQRGKLADFDEVDLSSLSSAYKELCQQLGVKAGQTVSERVIEMFVRPMGYKTVEEILNRMSSFQKEADRRSREMVDRSRLKVKSGDLVKGVDSQYITNILENGSVAKEYLGASSGSDATPFDTDLEIIKEDDHINIASGYGDLIFVIKNRGQFQLTSNQQPEEAKFDPNKYELFQAGIVDNAHYGVRTGFSCTEINFMIFKKDDLKKQERLFYAIARNGYYIPVVNEKYELILTPELFDEYRRCLAGIERFGGDDMKFISSKEEKYYSDIIQLIDDKERDNERLNKLKGEIRKLILEVLVKFNINLKGEYDDGLIGAELLDIGSTGRGTNAIGEGDFDFNLKLDSGDFEKFLEIAEEIKQQLGGDMSQPPIMPSYGNNFQFRFFGTNIFSQKSIDIDIGFIKKTDLNVYASHDAIADKLTNIYQKYGQGAYQEAIANILLVKKWLKSGEAYKKGEYGQGGLGGIGVENLILAYGGNIKLAFQAFYSAARNPDGSIKDFDSFRNGFKLLDAGMNLRSNRYDNFIYNMNSDGYNKMIKIIKEKFPEFI